MQIVKTKDLLKQVEQLPPALQRKVVDFAHSLAQSMPQGTPVRELLEFAGILDAEEAEAMTGAIEASFFPVFQALRLVLRHSYALAFSLAHAQPTVVFVCGDREPAMSDGMTVEQFAAANPLGRFLVGAAGLTRARW